MAGIGAWAQTTEGSILIGGLASTGTVSYSQQFGFSGYLIDK